MAKQTKDIKFCLRKYTKPSDKEVCPSCGRRSFKPFVDEMGAPLSSYFEGTRFEELAKTVGRCDHERDCNYFFGVKEFFEQTKCGRLTHSNNWQPPPPPKPAPPLNADMPSQYLSDQSSLVQYWLNHVHFPRERLYQTIRDYRVGATADGRIVYWMIDQANQVHDGKIMAYKPDGHRDKEKHPLWMYKHKINSSALSEAKKEEYKAMTVYRPYFGTHLLSDPRYKGMAVGIVEGEKSALIASTLLGKVIWIAVGTKLFNLEKLDLAIKQKRRLYFFPDKDGIEDWRTRLQILKVPNAKLMDEEILRYAVDDNDDIGDILVRRYSQYYTIQENEDTEATAKIFEQMGRPEIAELCREFNYYLHTGYN